MNLLIISNMPHYQEERLVVGWGPTVQEIDALAGLFDQVTHLATLYPGDPPPSALPYQAANVSVIGLPPAGGDHLADKIGFLPKVPLYLRQISAALSQADVVHLRAPASLALLAMLLLAFRRKPLYRWAKYAGNWKPSGDDPLTYRFQRWWLEHNFHRGVVTVNGRWPGQPGHVFSFLNPSLSADEQAQCASAAAQKTLAPPYRLLYAGRVETGKGVGRLLEIARMLHEQALPFHLDILGDGPERSNFEQQAAASGLAEQVTFWGWLPKPELARFYAQAHFFVMPTTACEGWPKVLSEAMACGAVPVAGGVSSIPQILSETQAGLALPPEDIQRFAQAILDYLAQPARWQAASRAGLEAATAFTYAAHLAAVKAMFERRWHLRL